MKTAPAPMLRAAAAIAENRLMERRFRRRDVKMKNTTGKRTMYLRLGAVVTITSGAVGRGVVVVFGCDVVVGTVVVVAGSRVAGDVLLSMLGANVDMFE